MKDALAAKIGSICLVGVFAFAQARAQTAPGLDVRKAMNAQEYKDAGLDKLSPSETAALNSWLTTFVLRARFAPRLNSDVSASRENADAIESAAIRV